MHRKPWTVKIATVLALNSSYNTHIHTYTHTHTHAYTQTTYKPTKRAARLNQGSKAKSGQPPLDSQHSSTAEPSY